MKQFKIWIAIALLIASISVLIIMLFNPQPIQIILETGQAITTKSPNYFTINTVILLSVCSFIMGLSITFLFYNSENNKNEQENNNSETKEIKKENKESSHDINYDRIIPLLRDDEKKAFHIIREHHGEILQNELVLKLDMSKVKTTRIIASLERKQIIHKQRHGMTNSIKLK